MTEVPTGMPNNQINRFGVQAASPALGCVGDICTFQVSRSSDDAGPNPVSYCSYSTMWNEVYFGLCQNNTPIVSGFRFTNVTIDKGTRIAQAYLEFTVDGPYDDQVSLNLYGEATGNSSTFGLYSPPGSPTRPALTQNFAAWNISSSSTDHWELGITKDTPDLTQVIQEIINRNDWTSGNALSIIAKSISASGVNRHRRVIGYDRPVWYPGAQYSAKLVIKLGTTTPVIFVPGVGGTELYNNGGEQWPRVQYLVDCLIQCPDDSLLLELRLAPDGISPFADNPIYTTTKVGDVLRLETFNIKGKEFTQDYYDTTFKTLEGAGYQEGVDLFPYPYDWRKDINWNSDQLLTFIDQVRDKTGANQVDLLAHSMGGLLVRAVLAKPDSVGKVRRVLTMGTPVLGAPMLLGILEYQMPCFVSVPHIPSWCIINPATIQDVITNFPSVYQVLPGPNYDKAEPSPLIIDYDTNGDGKPEGPQSYAQWTAIVSAHRNAPLMGMNAPFHNTYDNLTLADPAVQFIRVVGDQSNTPAQIREYKNCTLWVFNCQIVYEIIQGTGDNTVPIFSANLYNPDRNFDLRNGSFNVYYHKVGHSDLPINASVLAFVTDYLTLSKFGRR